MDFDIAKENIQPLASGRNVEHLETALIAESDQEIQQKLREQRNEFEKAIQIYEGDDPLQLWYDYIVWVEQVNPKSGKESALHELLSNCLALFEKDERYFQDIRMLKLYIKYIDSEQNPPQFYEQLYNNGIGTMLADLYLCWAHYYDYCDNFEKAESVYQKGLNARAQPIELLEQAHRQFGFSMSQRILHNDESMHREFRSSMDEQRLALTSLRAHKHRHVGSIRTGSAVKSYKPGRIEQPSSSKQHTNRKVQVFEDTNDTSMSPTKSTSVVQSILNSTKKQENLREPGPWNKAKIKSQALFTGVCSTKPSFAILEDNDFPPISLPDSENNYVRGIQLPKNFVRQNLPQDEFAFELHRDDDPSKNTKYRYDKFMVFPSKDKCYSLEELWAYKWLKKHNVENNFTREQDKVWKTGYGIPIRLPPHFVKNNAKQDDWKLSAINFDEVLANGQRKFGFNINLIYSSLGEFSPEEILQSKWLNGDLISQREVEMELTCGFERREEIFIRKAERRSMALGGRKSILPRKSHSPRKSINERKSLPATTSEVAEEPKSILKTTEESLGAAKRTGLPKRKSVYVSRALDSLTTIPEFASPPSMRRKLDEDEETVERNDKPNSLMFNIYEDAETADVFKVPQSVPVQKTRISTGFQDEDLDGCTTQTFNFFIKSQSISTPKVEKPYAKLGDHESVETLRKGLEFGDDNDTSPSDDQNAVTSKQPFASRCIEAEPYTIESHEVYRQKLSAIMETTEEGATVSSLAATASSKSSSGEEFDSKHINRQSSVAMSTYRHHTVISNTTKMSTSNVSTVNRENESRKASTIGFEIYQEDEPIVSQRPAKTSKYADTSKALSPRKDLNAFEKTLASDAPFHIYEDGNDEVTDAAQTQTNSTKMEVTLTTADNAKAVELNNEEFELSKADTATCEWSCKTLTTNNDSLVPTKSVLKTTSLQAEIQAHSDTHFQILQEDTGFTMPAINFTEDKTEKFPPSLIQSHASQLIPTICEREKTETISMLMPEMPDDDGTKNISKMLKINTSRLEPTTKELNQSVFQFPQEDTITNVFSAKFHDEKPESISNVPNLMQISLINTNNMSEIPMIPEMPTLPEMDFDYEAMGNCKQSALNQSKMEPTLSDTNKMSANQSMFHRFLVDSRLDQSKLATKSNTSNLINFDASKQMSSAAEMLPIQNKSETNVESVLCAAKVSLASKRHTKIPKPSIDDEIYAAINPSRTQPDFANKITDGNQSIFSKSKHTIDDEFYAMIKSPVCKNEQTFTDNDILIVDTPVSPQARQSLRETLAQDLKKPAHQISLLRDPSMSLLEPMQRTSVRETSANNSQIGVSSAQKNLTDEIPRAFSEENPNTAMFSLNGPFIKNSTILAASTDNIINITDELKSSFHLNKGKIMATAQENPNEAADEILHITNSETIRNEPRANSNTSAVRESSIEIKEEHLSFENKTINASKTQTNIDDELYECIKDKDTETNEFFNLSIQLTDAEMVNIGLPSKNCNAESKSEVQIQSDSPKFVICNPVSIRPSQFPINETETTVTNTTIKLDTEPLTEHELDILKSDQITDKQAEASLIVVEDADDYSAVCSATTVNKSRRETVHSPFKNRYAANLKLNETISAVKEIDPFDIHLQNVLLDDIDFIEYIKSLEYVHMMTRVRLIELKTVLEIGSETFDILEQIGRGSFGFVYSGKSTKTGEMYAFKQERPANLWEFYIALEIHSRVEDVNILPGFMSMKYAMVGHNSSIFATEFCEYGSLFDVCNRHKLNTCRYLDESIAMIFSEQMLSILDHLHASNIIHGDIKPDNFLLMKKLSYGNNEIVIKLIDYGRSIDLNFFPPNQTFTSTLNTKNFICTEMLENRPWKHQVDLFCLASTIHALVCGKYMNVKKQPDSKIRPYVLSEDLPPYLDVQLWEHILYSLINVRDHNNLPDLQNLRLRIRESIVEKEHFVQSKISKFNAFLDG